METKPINARGRSLIHPCGLAGSRWEPAAAGLCGVALGGVFGSEVLTPDDVMASLGLAPLLAAQWTLSGRLAAAVSALALVLFSVVLVLEEPNRTTLLAVGVTGAVLGIAVRRTARTLSSTGAPSARSGFGPRAHTVHGLASLSRREADVARLASESYTAGEIGLALHISERTVETHLVHIYAKLGVTSKRALVRMGRIQGPTDSFN